MFSQVKVLLQGHSESEARIIIHIIIYVVQYVDAQILQNLENYFKEERIFYAILSKKTKTKKTLKTKSATSEIRFHIIIMYSMEIGH